VCVSVCVCVWWGLASPPLWCDLEVRNVEQCFPRKDSVGQLALGFGQQVDVEGFDFLAGFNCRVNATLNPLAVANQFELLRVQGGARLIQGGDNGLRSFGL
jgi:hypothetical protein